MVAKALVEHVFLRYGLCSEILSDLGLEFNNEIMNELLHLLGVNRLRTSGYRPQTNGTVEVWHRTLHSMIAKLVDEGQRNWSSLLPYVTFCYNATEHSATGFPPFFVLHGRMPLWTVDLVLPDVSEEPLTVPEYTAKIVDRLQHVSALVRENLHAAASSASRRPDRKPLTWGTRSGFSTLGNMSVKRQSGSRTTRLKATSHKNSTMCLTS